MPGKWSRLRSPWCRRWSGGRTVGCDRRELARRWRYWTPERKTHLESNGRLVSSILVHAKRPTVGGTSTPVKSHNRVSNLFRSHARPTLPETHSGLNWIPLNMPPAAVNPLVLPQISELLYPSLKVWSVTHLPLEASRTSYCAMEGISNVSLFLGFKSTERRCPRNSRERWNHPGKPCQQTLWCLMRRGLGT